MALPKRRKSKSRTRMGRSHHALKSPSLSKCPSCGELMIPHRVCLNCGEYRGRVVLPAKEE